MIQEPDYTQQNTVNHPVFTNPLDKFLAKRGITRDPLREDYPFWKLRLTEAEVDTLKRDVNPGNLDRKGLECAILSAEWYKRAYTGGCLNKEDVALWAGINKENHQDDFFNAAKEALDRSKYTIIKKQNILYFRTLLCLGGLPITYIKQNIDNIQGIVPMFKSLVSNLSKATNFDWTRLDSPDYNAQADIKAYATITGVTDAVKENLAEAAMQTARGIICNDPRFLPFDADDEDIKEFIELLNKENESTRKHQDLNFALQWCYDASQRQFLVQVNAPKEIAAHEIVDDHGKQLDGTSPNLFKLFIANSEVATYHFAKEEVDNQDQKIYKFRREGSVLPVPITLDQAMVEVTVKSDDHQKLALNLPNNNVPDFSEPQVWVQNEKNLSLYEKFTKQSSNHFLALYDSKDWTIRREEKASIEASKIIATAFEDTLTLVHRKTGEELTLLSTVSEYQVALLGTELPWIEKASHMLFARVPLIKVYDADNKVVSPKDYTCWYRTEPHSSRGEDVGPWQELKPYTQLPLGFIAIKVELPDGMEHIQRGYSIGDVRFTTKDAKEDCLTLVAESRSQLKIEAIERGGLTITPQKPEMNAQSWLIQLKDINTRPATCGFRLSVEGHRSTTIHLALGFRGVLLADVEGNRVIYQTLLSLYNLNHYMLHSYEGNHIGRLSMIRAAVNDYSKGKTYDGALQQQIIDKGLIADVDIPRYTITQEERSTGTSITFPIEKGSRSLSEYISDHYKRLLCAHTDRSYHPEYMVKLEIGERREYNDRVSLVNGTAYYLKEFLLTTKHEEERLFCVQELFDNAIKTNYNGQLYALPVDWDIKPQDIQAIPLEESTKQDNSFALPKGFQHKEFIIFSAQHDARKVVPRFHSFNPYLTGTDKQRKSFREERIKQWKRFLTGENCWEIGGKWEEVCRVFSILADHQVPYSTHLAFEIIARDAELLAKFVIAMCSLPKISNETYQSDLVRDGGLRRFERELSTAIHWVQPPVWNELFSQIEDLELLTQLLTQFSEVMRNSFRIARNIESDNEKGTSDTQNKAAEKECLDAFIQYLQQGTKPNQGKITPADANEYKSYLNGVDKDFADLPFLPKEILEDHNIFKAYFLPQALKSLRGPSQVYQIQQALLFSPLIVAEHLKDSDRWHLFAEEQKDLASVISFNHHMFPGVYIKILMNGLSIN